LNFGTGVLGLSVIFEQVDTVRGWDFSATLAVLGIYLTVNALRDLFIGPSLNALAGMDGDVWTGKLDFTMLRPVDVQFWASLRQWRLFSLFDLMLGFGVIVAAVTQFDTAPSLINLLAFLILLISGVIVIYAILLVFTALVFWSPGFLFTWVFDGIFQLARYPVGLYPGWLRLALTWVIPVGLVTTIPAQALTGDLQIGMLIGSLALSAALFAGASILFHRGMRRYASASS
jgi:ABC-2 type transport system permease protein